MTAGSRYPMYSPLWKGEVFVSVIGKTSTLTDVLPLILCNAVNYVYVWDIFLLKCCHL